MYGASTTYQAHKNFLLLSFTRVLKLSVHDLLKWSTPRYLKVEILQVPEKVRTVLV